MVELP